MILEDLPHFFGEMDMLLVWHMEFEYCIVLYHTRMNIL